MSEKDNMRLSITCRECGLHGGNSIIPIRPHQMGVPRKGAGKVRALIGWRVLRWYFLCCDWLAHFRPIM